MFGFGKKAQTKEVTLADIGLLIDARVAVERQLHESRLLQENQRIAAEHPGATVAAQFILTDSIWNGPHSGHLLGALQATPYDLWNVRFLPADDASAAILGQPRVYLGEVPEISRTANSLIAQIFERAGLPADSIEALRASEQVKENVRRDLAGLCGYFYEDYMLPILREEG